ncbi:hypothetical protein D3C87_2099740 [compost metagenome]
MQTPAGFPWYERLFYSCRLSIRKTRRRRSRAFVFRLIRGPDGRAGRGNTLSRLSGEPPATRPLARHFRSGAAFLYGVS